MIAVIKPRALKGVVEVPSSKSCAHRALIAAALSDRPCRVVLNAAGEDIDATARCLNALGADIRRTDDGFDVSPVGAAAGGTAGLDCGESGSTLRFLLPVAAALGRTARFTGSGRLPGRPNRLLADALRAHGILVSADRLPLTVTGRLRGGRYGIAGDISSQYVTGLLLALPLCAEDSEIALTAPLASAPYVDLTLETLGAFGVRIERTGDGWRVPGGQRYASLGRFEVEGDWSAAANWICAGHMGMEVSCAGLREDSAQGDRRIRQMLGRLGGGIDASDTPDLVPALAVAASVHPGRTRITGAARLRAKESDRLAAVAGLLNTLGGRCRETSDGLVIDGVPTLKGGRVNGRNDHRIVMAAAIAACRCEGPVEITDAEAVRKSWPGFFDAYRAAGGQVALRD